MNCTERETKVKQREKEREREREREIKEDKTEIGVSRQFAGQKKKKSARDQYPANMRNRMVSPKKAHTLRKRERERERERENETDKKESVTRLPNSSDAFVRRHSVTSSFSKCDLESFTTDKRSKAH